ncbi:NHL repeat containing protein [Oopsacas minuta]|uniref:NHL repeat containing protein n=1 Tax=Oopsacas minuta TaxID=111878 RepID=A0AAV7KJM8_9METZ|nr:NHL repeat containing protein [Oopsacas minuta]
MVTQFPETIGVAHLPEPLEDIDPIAIKINQSIDKLIFLLNQRRGHLLAMLRDRREEMRAELVARQEMEEELVQIRQFVEGQIKHNKLHTMQNRMVAETEAKLAELHLNAPLLQEPRNYPTRDPSQPHPRMPAIPNYAAFQLPIVAVGKRGIAPGEFNSPKGVTIEPESGHIYVTDMDNNCIKIFSQAGHHLNLFGDRHLAKPWGILIHEDKIYVTDIEHQGILLFKLPDLTMIKRVGKRGSGSREFNNPLQPAISPNQHIYVPDRNNNRLQILTTNLEFKDSLQHQTMTNPMDIKFSNNEMFVLSADDNPCMHVFTLSGEKSRSFVTRGEGMQVTAANFFCVDGHNNIIISDYPGDKIKVFSPEGDLLHWIRHTYPTGILIANNSKLVCISRSADCLQIFSALFVVLAYY